MGCEGRAGAYYGSGACAGGAAGYDDAAEREYMHEHIPRAQMEVISPSAHYGLLEQNVRYNSAIARFAASCFQGASR